MLIIGCDFHPGFQQVAIFDNRTGEIQEKQLQHRTEAPALREQQRQRGLKPAWIRDALRGAEAPLFHVTAAFVATGSVFGRVGGGEIDHLGSGTETAPCISNVEIKIPNVEMKVPQDFLYSHTQ